LGSQLWELLAAWAFSLTKKKGMVSNLKLKLMTMRLLTRFSRGILLRTIKFTRLRLNLTRERRNSREIGTSLKGTMPQRPVMHSC
jgi:hypothetical protein